MVLMQIFIWLKEQGASFSAKTFIPLLQSGEYSSFKTGNETFYYALFMLKELGTIDFPAIGEDIEDDLVLLPRPDNDNWGVSIRMQVMQSMSGESLKLSKGFGR